MVSHPFVTMPVAAEPPGVANFGQNEVWPSCSTKFGQHQLLAKPSSSFSGRVVPVGAGGGLGRGTEGEGPPMVGPRAQNHEAPKGGAPQVGPSDGARRLKCARLESTNVRI